MLNLSPGSIFQEAANEGDPHAVDEVADKHLPHTEDDDDIGDESTQISGDEGGPTHVVGNTPYNRPRDAAAVQGEGWNQIEQA